MRSPEAPAEYTIRFAARKFSNTVVDITTFGAGCNCAPTVVHRSRTRAHRKPARLWLSLSLTGRDESMEYPNHIPPTSASRWSVVTFRAPNDASKARARNSCVVVTLFTPNTAGVSHAIGVVARSAARSPATRTDFAGGQGPSHLHAATNATTIRMLSGSKPRSNPKRMRATGATSIETTRSFDRFVVRRTS